MEIIPYTIYVHIAAATQKHGVEVRLFLAIGLQEKGEYAWTDAVLGDMDRGLSISPMQLYLGGAGKPPSGWGKQAWANQLIRPEVWTDIAARYIRDCLNAFPDDLEKAIAAYNRGISGTVDNYANYVMPVLANYRRLRAEGFQVVGSGDHDRQIFLPETAKWVGEFTEYAPQTGSIREATINILGVAQANANFINKIAREIAEFPH